MYQNQSHYSVFAPDVGKKIQQHYSHDYKPFEDLSVVFKGGDNSCS